MSQPEELSDEEYGERIAQILSEPAPPKPPPPKQVSVGWMPDLNPTQRLIFDDPSANILFDAEKSSGKSIIGLHKLVRHCYEANAGLAYIIVTGYQAGEMGIWHDLQTLVLPAWKEGNKYPEWCVENGVKKPHPRDGELMDHGIGLQYTDSKLDPKTKASKIWIANMHGGWSMVILISIPHAKNIEQRVKGPAPSYVYIEELTNCESIEYYSFLRAQLVRRRGMQGLPQQFTASCNPAGPSHWVYKLWFVKCLDPNGKLCPDGLRRKHSFSRYHVPLSENEHRLPPGYREGVQEAFMSDPVRLAQLADGIWIDRPSGEAIFRHYFVDGVHSSGDVRKGQFLAPRTGYPIVVSMDPGPKNFSVHMMQFVKAGDKHLWRVFDELNFVGQYVPYHRVVADVLRRLWFWCERAGNEGAPHVFSLDWIADEAAFNQVRNDGSYDAQQFEQLASDWLNDHPAVKLSKPRLQGCPKGPDSIPARVRLVIELLQTEQLVIGGNLIKTKQMFEMMERAPQKPGKYDQLQDFRPADGVHKHSFDSLSYGLFKFSTGFRMPAEREEPATGLFEVGAR